MPRVEYETPLAPQAPDRVAPGDRARRDQDRRRRESERRKTQVEKREPVDADKKDGNEHPPGPGSLVDVEV